MMSLTLVWPAFAADSVQYKTDIKPILKERCYACHGVLKQSANLRLDTAQAAFSGGDSGAALVPGVIEESRLIDRITGDAQTRMPPEGEPLSPEQIELIKTWVKQGAAAPSHEEPEADPASHWAFQVPVSALPPAAQRHRNLIDVLLSEHHQRLGLKASPPLARSFLLRRVSLDLTGLPPTVSELNDFEADLSPEAYEKVVNRLLASPQYGERWGRHWMDIWRYSDWSGEENNQVRGSPQHIWRWRDWIVESLNADLGYDRMIQLMLAADEFAPHDQQALRATGFLARNWYKYNRHVWLEDTVEHTGKAFLGLTMNCAKCHDHKYDPISQEHYYQFRAFFESHEIQTDAVPGESDLKKDGLVRVIDTLPQAPTYLFHRGDANQAETSRPLAPGLPTVLGGELSIQPVTYFSDQKKPVQSTGRRSALSLWLTNRQNPLTARVAVNHIWLRHFGQPLVESVTDFGLRAPRPEFVDILDSLAVELMDQAWSMQSLHRTIVLSEAYQMDSRYNSPGNQSFDPDNRFLWRMNSRRQEGESLRDSVLFLAGSLDLEPGGPEISLDEQITSRRRSLYFRHGHERQVPFLATFDGANVMDCYRRNSTIVPQQALALANDIVVREQSRRIANQIAIQTSSSTEFINAAFRQLLCRPPLPSEQARSEQFLQDQAEFLKGSQLTFTTDSPPALSTAAEDTQLRAQQSLVHVLLNHNDFVSIR